MEEILFGILETATDIAYTGVVTDMLANSYYDYSAQIAAERARALKNVEKNREDYSSKINVIKADIAHVLLEYEAGNYNKEKALYELNYVHDSFVEIVNELRNVLGQYVTLYKNGAITKQEYFVKKAKFNCYTEPVEELFEKADKAIKGITLKKDIKEDLTPKGIMLAKEQEIKELNYSLANSNITYQEYVNKVLSLLNVK